jgi:hypothetical protein
MDQAAKSQIGRAFLTALLVAGTLDILSAFAFSALNGVTPGQVLRYVASGPFGDGMREWGLTGAAIGLLVHFFLMNLMVDVLGLAAMLLPVRGIGPWSVDMFLMFALARPDVLPVGDLGIRKGMQRHFGLRKLPEADKMTRLAAPWRPYRSVAAWYMWRLLET